jgi:lysophospholipase L1-like esterase
LKRLIALGDSVFAGYDGKKNGPKYIIQTLGQLAHVETTNIAVGGTSFTDPRGLIGQTASADFSKYDYVVIGFGINDFRFNVSPISQMQLALQGSITKMKQQNPNIQIFLTTPLQSWENGVSSLNQKNRIGVSQNDIDNMICSVARMNGLKCNDWRVNPIVTDANHNETLGDGTVHPTAETQKKMGERFFQVFFNGQSVNDDQPAKPDLPDQPTKPDQPDKPKPTIELDQIASRNDVLPTSNHNFQKIFQLLEQIAEETMDDSLQVDWELQDFTFYNRACFDYLINTVKLIQRKIDDYLSTNDVVDDDFNDVTKIDLMIPDTLDMEMLKNIMNKNFKKLAQVLTSMSNNL